MKTGRKFLLLTTFLPGFWLNSTEAQEKYQMKPVPIQSRWAKEVSQINTLKEYPRPQLQRSNWMNLNGLWDYAVTVNGATRPSTFQGQILVPYPLESALSGVKKALLPSQILWYKRTFSKLALSWRKDETQLWRS